MAGEPSGLDYHLSRKDRNGRTRPDGKWYQVEYYRRMLIMNQEKPRLCWPHRNLFEPPKNSWERLKILEQARAEMRGSKPSVNPKE